MGTAQRFDEYLEHLSQGLRPADRHAGLRGYCTGADAAAGQTERGADGGTAGADEIEREAPGAASLRGEGRLVG